MTVLNDITICYRQACLCKRLCNKHKNKHRKPTKKGKHCYEISHEYYWIKFNMNYGSSSEFKLCNVIL